LLVFLTILTLSLLLAVKKVSNNEQKSSSSLGGDNFFDCAGKNMKVNGLQAEMQAMKLEAQSTTRPATGQQVSADFGAVLSDAVKSVNNLQSASSELATRFDQGDRSVSLSDVMIARNKSSVAFEATVQVRNKMVDAYKQLMNMPV